MICVKFFQQGVNCMPSDSLCPAKSAPSTPASKPGSRRGRAVVLNSSVWDNLTRRVCGRSRNRAGCDLCRFHFHRSRRVRLLINLGVIVALMFGVLPISSSAANQPSSSTLSPSSLAAPKSVDKSRSIDYGKLPLSFEYNAGQTDPSVRFLARTSTGTFLFKPSQLVLVVSATARPDKTSPQDTKELSSKQPSRSSTLLTAMRLNFLGTNPAPEVQVQGGQQLPGKINYLIGADRSKWHTNIPTYSTINYMSLYPGIDLQYQGGVGGTLTAHTT